MEDQYDPEYAQEVLERVEGYDAEKRFFKGLVVTGRENLLKNQNRQRVYLANHLGHMDYALLWLDFHRHGIKMPRIPGGSNLNKKFLKNRGYDLGKLGAYFMDRDLMEEDSQKARDHKKETIEGIREIIHKGLDILIFPEGGRSYNGELFESYHTGGLKATLYEEKDIDIVPIAFAYDHRVEKKFLRIIKHGNKKTLLGKILYYGPDVFAHFINRRFAKAIGYNVGNAYINIGKPTPLSEIVEIAAPTGEKAKAVKEFSITEIKRLYSEIKTIR